MMLMHTWSEDDVRPTLPSFYGSVATCDTDSDEGRCIVTAQSGPSFNPAKIIASPKPPAAGHWQVTMDKTDPDRGHAVFVADPAPAAKLTPVPHIQPHHQMFSSDAYPPGWTDADEAMYEAEVLRVAHSKQSPERLTLLRQLQASPGGRMFWMTHQTAILPSR
jgi:hypothetical protein